MGDWGMVLFQLVNTNSFTKDHVIQAFQYGQISPNIIKRMGARKVELLITLGYDLPGLAQSLIKANYNPDVLIDGMTMLHREIEKCSVDTVSPCIKFLIEDLHAGINAKIVSSNTFYNDMTPVMYCMATNKTGVLAYLLTQILTQNIDLNSRNSTGETLLTLASLYNYTNYITYLLEVRFKNPELNADDFNHELYLVYLRAVYFNNADIVSVISVLLDEMCIINDRFF